MRAGLPTAGARWYGFGDHGVGTNLGTFAHGKAAQHFRARADNHAVFQRRMAFFAAIERRAAQRHALINRAIIAHHGSLADDHAQPVVDEHAMANLRAGVNFNAGAHPPEMAEKAS